MIQYIVRRLLLMIPTMCGILLISFCVIKLAPGDPASLKHGGVGGGGGGLDSERGTEAALEKFRKVNHFDEPLTVQFGYFLKRLATFDLHRYDNNQPIMPELKERLWVSVRINLIVFFLIYVIAIPLGILSASNPDALRDRLITVLLFVLYSLPSFWVALMLRDLFNKGGEDNFIWFPLIGLHTDSFQERSPFVDFEWQYFWSYTLDYLHHLVLPIICLTYGSLAYLSRQMRAGMLEVIRQDYIRTARAKGAGNMRVLFVHALRNGLFPIITIFASLLPFLVGGSVIIETIFQIDGMGRYAYQAVMGREYDIVMATLILSAMLTLVGILISDIMYVLVNPQVSFHGRGR